MKFELSQEVMDQIIFGMENQEELQLFDTVELKLIPETEIGISAAEDGQSHENNPDQIPEDRFLPLPEWRSVDGYNLMEGFVGSLRNPMQRENLRQILQSGRGVFRQFKDAVKERKEIERLWFRYKQKEMNRRVVEWFNDLREFWGLEPLSLEEEAETEDLLLTDFVFLIADPTMSDALGAWDRRLFADMFPRASPEECDYLYEIRRCGLPKPAASLDSLVIRSCNPVGEAAGFIWILEHDLPSPGGASRIARIVQLGIEPEYRGLGMGTALIHFYRKKAQERGVNRILIDVPAAAEFIGQSFQREGFQEHSVTWELDLTQVVD